MIPEAKIEEVRRRVNLVEVVSRYVELKKAGHTVKGLCPFHGEKTPSFFVYEESDPQRFKCFGCQAGGDVIAFVQRYLGKSFVDAVKDLAQAAGVDLEMPVDPAAELRGQLREAAERAAVFFQGQLKSQSGRAARAYLLQERALTDEVCQRFGLGWAPLSWSGLAEDLARAGLVDAGLQLGVLQAREKGGGVYDFFRGRVVLPIRSPEGRVLGFGGRLLPGQGEGPKYLNTRESPLYAKSDVLYGLDQAREEVVRQKGAVLVEGYFDVVALHQAGVRHAAALCSTTLTAGHLATLDRFGVRDLVLLLDGDGAGREAVEKLASTVLGAGKAARVAILPAGDDPDTFVRREGAAGVERLLLRAQPLSTHLFLTVLPGGARSTYEAKMAALERLRPLLAGLAPGVVRSSFVGGLARHMGVGVRQIEDTLGGQARAPKAPPAAKAPPGVDLPPDPLEIRYVAAVAKDGRLVAQDVARAGDCLRHPGLRILLAMLPQVGQEALAQVPTSLRRELEAVLCTFPAAELERDFAVTCRRIQLRELKQRLEVVRRQAAERQISARESLAEVGQLAGVIFKLQKELMGLQQGRGAA